MKKTSLFIPGSQKTLQLEEGPDGLSGLKSEAGPTPARTFVISVPKGGTYLLAALLREAGLVDTEGHFSAEVFHDMRGLSLSDKFVRAQEHVVEMPIQASAGLIMAGQFGVGHIDHGWWPERAFVAFSKILAIRDLRACLVSAMRHDAKRLGADPDWLGSPAPAWVSATEDRERMVAWLAARGPDLAPYFRQTLPWMTVPGVLRCAFEDMLGDAGRERQCALARAIVDHVGLSIGPEGIEAIVDRTLGSPTLTFSGARSALDRYWSPAAEEQFEALGICGLNAAYGYPETWRAEAR